MTAPKLVPLGGCTRSVPTWNPARANADEEFTYIDLSAIDQEFKKISGTKQIRCEDAPSRARQLIESGDILVSTVRPNLNGVAFVDVNFHGATASTGFCVLRPKPEILDGRFAFHWVQSPAFIDDMIRKATGASYPAVSDRIILESAIPLPAIEEQRRIAAILDQADALRAKRREALAELDGLAQAIFVEMFGNQKAQAWPLKNISDVLDEANGSIRTGPFGSQLLHSEFVNEGIAVLGIDNAVSNTFRWGERRHITEDKYQQLRRYTVKPGDVLITIMGTCGRCAVVPNDIPLAINTKHLCCITLDRTKCLPFYLHAYFLMHPASRKYLESTAKGAIMAGLNMGLIKYMPLVLPPLELQKIFVSRSQSLESLKATHRTALTELDALFASLQHRAFRGEL